MATPSEPEARVLIIGCGFGGLTAAKAFEKSTLDVTVVDRHVYSTFQPLLYQVATGALNPGDIAYPIRSLVRRRRMHFRHGEVVGIDTAARSVRLADGDILPYDYLIVSSGAAVNYFGITGAAEHTLALYTRTEAIALRDQLMGKLEQLASAKTPGELVICVVGGGPTGVEMAGSLAELRDTALAEAFPEIDASRIRVVLVERTDELLGPFDPRLRRYAHRQLERRRVELLLGKAITRVTTDEVFFEDGGSLNANLVVWAAGVQAPVVADWKLPRGRAGRIEIDDDLRVHDEERVFAVGDVAISDENLPQLAQPAIQMGRHAARQILRLLGNKSPEPFRYRDLGTMATIGRRAAIAELPGHIRLRGTVAWLAWLALHIFDLLGNRNRISALLNLSWRYLAWPRGSGVIVGDVPEHTSSGSEPSPPAD